VSASFEAVPASGSLGAVVSGVDLKRALDDRAMSEIRRLLLERLALFFPDQHLTSGEQHAFAERLGVVQRHPDRAEWVEGTDQEVVIVSPKGGVSSVWHCDYDEDFVPCGSSMLNMVTPAEGGGGDTIFCSSYRIWEQISGPMRDLMRNLTAVHQNIGNSKRRRNSAEFPLVWTNPETGREGLLYSAHHVVGFRELPQSESDLLLGHLRRLTATPEFAYRHRWQAGTLALWDNRATQHYAVPDFAGERMLYQITVAGSGL
jgi:taurine dioxygenase